MIRKNLLGSFIFTIILFSFALFHSGVSAQETTPPNEVYAEGMGGNIRVSAYTVSNAEKYGIRYNLSGLTPGLDYKIEIKNSSTVIDTIEINGSNINEDGSYTRFYNFPAKDIKYNINFSIQRDNRMIGVPETIAGLGNISITADPDKPAKTVDRQSTTPLATVPNHVVEQETTWIDTPMVLTADSVLNADNSLGVNYTLSNLERGRAYRVMLKNKDGETVREILYTKEMINSIPEINGTIALVDGFDVDQEGEYYIAVQGNNTGVFLDEASSLKILTENFSVTAQNPRKTYTGNGSTTGGGSTTGSLSGRASQYFGNSADIKSIVTGLYYFIAPIAVVVALIKLLISLSQVASGGGNPQALAQAKEDIVATLLGLLVVLGAVTLINILGSALGI